jgi:sirohydrochlorin ferrochelatase
MRFLLTLVLLANTGCATSSQPSTAIQSQRDIGILVMAHGGTEHWNRAVAASTEPLRHHGPVALALGMADPVTLQAAIDSLQEAGVHRVAVVRLFVSGASFREQTRFLLGLDSTPPEHFVSHSRTSEALSRIPHTLAVATHNDGLSDWSGLGPLVAQRALEVSENREDESVLLVAHGMGSENHNDALRRRMEHAGQAVRNAGFRRVKTATLREDWAPQRAVAEQEIRGWVKEQSELGRRVIVVPFRLAGFGPYADVLDGLTYVAARSFLPHLAVGDWIHETAQRIICESGWATGAEPCSTLGTGLSTIH